MRNLLILSSALVLLGVGSAAAAENIHVSEQNSAPRHRIHTTVQDHSRGHVARSHVGRGHVDRGAVTSAVPSHGTAGFSAAWGFGTSDQSTLPAPRFQVER